MQETEPKDEDGDELRVRHARFEGSFSRDDLQKCEHGIYDTESVTIHCKLLDPPCAGWS